MSRSTLLHIDLIAPKPSPSNATHGESWLLNAFIAHLDRVVLALGAPGVTKHQNLGRIYADVRPREGGSFTVELGAILADRLPPLGADDYILSVRLDGSDSSKILAFSNQMVRIRYRDTDGEMITGITHLARLPDALKTSTATAGAHVDYLPTVVTARYELHGEDAEDALARGIEPSVDDFIRRINYVVAAHLTVASPDMGILTPSYDRGSFDALYLLVQGSEETLAGNTLALSLFRVGRVAPSYPNTAVEKIRRLAGGEEIMDDVAQLLRAAKSYIDAGLAEFSLLQLAIAAEIATTRFVHAQYLARGVSKSKLDEYRTELTFSTLLNIEVMALSPDDRKPDRALIGQVNRVRDLRNRLMHYGEFNTGSDELRVLHEAVVQYVDALHRC